VVSQTKHCINIHCKIHHLKSREQLDHWLERWIEVKDSLAKGTNLILRSGCPSVRILLSRPAHTIPISLLTLCVSPSHSLKNISSSLSPIACCCVVRSLLPSFLSRTPSHAARLPHPTPCSIPHHATAAAHRAPSPACAKVLLGATEVLPTLPFHTKRSWPLSTPWLLHCTTSARRCCDENVYCKHMSQVF
jgi:hypothetical protein